ncbi:MAG: N-acetylmuramoyl-L-alanine amidase [Rickettsiales bacterium]|nr:N-acetylmuramoyl-L-alanine amidase [Rickettsiales bacterium]
MKITKIPSPNFSNRPETAEIDTIILHYTGMKSTKEALQRMCDINTEVSCHYLIAENGEIIQLVDDEFKAWHAGKSHWAGRENLNNYSIGIEISNLGHEWGYKPFEDEQIDSLIELCKSLVQNYNIKPQNILGHSDIAPVRKEDPGELFPWKLLADEGVGLWYDFEVGKAEYKNIINISENPTSEITKQNIINIQKKLKQVGYNVGKAGALDEATNKAIIAFYRRFIPQRILMCKNKRYPEYIAWDELSNTIADNIIGKIC